MKYAIFSKTPKWILTDMGIGNFPSAGYLTFLKIRSPCPYNRKSHSISETHTKPLTVTMPALYKPYSYHKHYLRSVQWCRQLRSF